MNNVVEITRQAPAKDSFEEFWWHYPAVRRQQKALCKVKWDAITGPGMQTKMFDKDSDAYVEIFLQATPDEIISGVKRYSERMKDPKGRYGSFKDDGRFICSAAVFLNQGRWLD
jgi:hypothetical protein